MFLQEIKGILGHTFVKIKYDCNGGFERCGKEWSLKLKDAKKNAVANGGKHICRQCQLRAKNPMKRKEVKEKVKKTTLEKYGVTCIMNKPEHIAGRNEKMFGTQKAIDARTEKTKQTNLERYGVEHAAQSEEKKQKTLEVFREKYRVDHPMQNDEVKEKVRQTCQERYGVDSVLSLPEVRIKAAQTTLEKYGVEHYNQLPEMKEYLRDNCKDWLAESYVAGGPNKGTIRPEEWNKKQRETIHKAIEDGTWRGGGKYSLRGWFTAKKCRRAAVYFKSSYELKVLLWLEDVCCDLHFYDYEPFAIQYRGTDEQIRNYYPDFLMRLQHLERPLLVEVKNDYMMKSGINMRKDEYAIAYANDNGLDYEWWGDEKIESLGVNLLSYKNDLRIIIDGGL